MNSILDYWVHSFQRHSPWPQISLYAGLLLFFYILFVSAVRETPLDRFFHKMSDVRSLAFLILCVSMVTSLTTSGIVLLCTAEALNLHDAGLLLIFFSPFLLAWLAYSTQRRYAQRVFAVVDDESSEDLRWIRSRFEHVLGSFKNSVRIRLSAIWGLSPNTIGTAENALIILPRNIRELYSSLKNRIGSKADHLMDFIALHEAAHVKARDYYVWTFGNAYLPLMLRWWFPFAVFFLFVRAFYVGLIEVYLASLWYAFALLVYLSALKVAISSILREREFEADVSAANEMPSESVRQIVESESALGGSSPLAFLFRSFEVFGPVRGPALAILHETLGDWRRRFGVGETHPTIERRIRNLVVHRHYFVRELAAENGIMIGIMASLPFTGLKILGQFFSTGQVGVQFEALSLVLWPFLCVVFFLISPLKSQNAFGLNYQEVRLSLQRSLVAGFLTSWIMIVLPASYLYDWARVLYAAFTLCLVSYAFIMRIMFERVRLKLSELKNFNSRNCQLHSWVALGLGILMTMGIAIWENYRN